LPADRFPVHGSRFRVSFAGQRLRFPDRAVNGQPVRHWPDRATLNPVYFLLYVDFWNMEYLDREKLIFWTFTGLVVKRP